MAAGQEGMYHDIYIISNDFNHLTGMRISYVKPKIIISEAKENVEKY